jgi:hypothetical protein
MKILEELEKQIKLSEARIALAHKQLLSNESGKIKLSYMAVASTELSIEKNTFLLNKFRNKLRKLQTENIDELEKGEENKAVIRENNYFKYQSQRIRHTAKKTETEINDALYIHDEIPENMKLEDIELFQIAHKSKDLFLEIHSDLDDELLEIKSEFLSLLEGNFNDSNHELKLLNYRIPIIILQLRILLKNIRENLDEETLNKQEFSGLPKFEDWWIQELWKSHQAYLGLFKWKEIILSLCITTEQRRAFEIIFKNWILVKKILNVKGNFAYFYNYAFDEMIFKYAELEDEFDESNLHIMKTIVEKITEDESFDMLSDEHNIVTPYMKFKIDKQIENTSKDKDN